MAEKSGQSGQSRSTGSSATLSAEDQAYRNKLRRLAATYSDAIRKYLQVHSAEKDNKNVIACTRMEVMFRRPHQRYPMDYILKFEQFLKVLFGTQTNTTSTPISQQRENTSISDKRSEGPPEKRLRLDGDKTLPVPQYNRQHLKQGVPKTDAKVLRQNSMQNTHDFNCKPGTTLSEKKTPEKYSVKPKSSADLKCMMGRLFKSHIQDVTNNSGIAKQQPSASQQSTPTINESKLQKSLEFFKSLSQKRKYMDSGSNNDSSCHIPEKQSKRTESPITKLGKLVHSSVGNVNQSSSRPLKLHGKGMILKEFLGHDYKMVPKLSTRQNAGKPGACGSQTPQTIDKSRTELKANMFYSKNQVGFGNPLKQTQSTPGEATQTKTPRTNVKIKSEPTAQNKSPTLDMKIKSEPAAQKRSSTDEMKNNGCVPTQYKAASAQHLKKTSPDAQARPHATQLETQRQSKTPCRSTLIQNRLQRILDSDKPVTGSPSGQPDHRPWTAEAADRYRRTRPVPCNTPSSSDRPKTWQTKVPTRTGSLSSLQAMTSQIGRKVASNKTNSVTDTPPSVGLKRQTDSSSGQIGKARRASLNATPSSDRGNPHVTDQTGTHRPTLAQHRVPNTSPATPVSGSSQPSRRTSIDKYKQCAQMLKNRLAAYQNMSSSGHAVKSGTSPVTPDSSAVLHEQKNLELLMRYGKKKLSERDQQMLRYKQAAIDKLSSLSKSPVKPGTSQLGLRVETKPNMASPQSNDSETQLNKQSIATNRLGSTLQASIIPSPSSSHASVTPVSTPSRRLSSANTSVTTSSTPSQLPTSASVTASSTPSRCLSSASPSVTSDYTSSRRLSSVSASGTSSATPSQRIYTSPSVTSDSTSSRRLSSVSASGIPLATPSQRHYTSPLITSVSKPSQRLYTSPSVTSDSTSSRRLSSVSASGTSAFTPSRRLSSVSGSQTSTSTSSTPISSASLPAFSPSQPMSFASASVTSVSSPPQPQSSTSSSKPSATSSASTSVGKSSEFVIKSESSGTSEPSESVTKSGSSGTGESLEPLSKSESSGKSSESVTKSESSGDKKSTSDSDSECIVCMENAINTVIYSCGHMCLCFECAGTVKDKQNECPICREVIKDIIKIYKS